MADMHYDEFGLFRENAEELGLTLERDPVVRRIHVDTPSGGRLSALVWGETAPEMVFLHGGAQNAHTWDSVALALDRPLLAIDLPGHGHSARREDKDYRPQVIAADIASVVEQAAPDADVLVGMSLGGLTATVVAAEAPLLVRRLAVVDVTPGVNRDKAKEIIDFVSGPEEFDSFDEILERTIQFNPTRSESSLRRGVLHNAVPREDGKWVWRWDLPDPDRFTDLEGRFADLWDAIEAVQAPMLLIQGGNSPVVDDDDIAELRRRRPGVSHVVVDDAGHSVQGDQPLRLAALLDDFAADR